MVIAKTVLSVVVAKLMDSNTEKDGVWMIKGYGFSMGDRYTYFLEGMVFKLEEDAQKFARQLGGADRKEAVFVKFAVINGLED